MSSRLFQKIREERGLAYSIYSAVNGFADCGFLIVYLATRPAEATNAVGLIRDALVDLRDHGPGDSELDVAKEHLKGSLMLSLESTSSRMSNLARQHMYFRKQFTLEETLEGIAAVTPHAIHRLSGTLFDGCPVTLAAVGPLDRLKLPRGGLTL